MAIFSPASRGSKLARSCVEHPSMWRLAPGGGLIPIKVGEDEAADPAAKPSSGHVESVPGGFSCPFAWVVLQLQTSILQALSMGHHKQARNIAVGRAQCSCIVRPGAWHQKSPTSSAFLRAFALMGLRIATLRLLIT